MTIEVYTVSSFIIFDKIIDEEIVSRIESIKNDDELDIISIFTNKEYEEKVMQLNFLKKLKHTVKTIF